MTKQEANQTLSAMREVLAENFPTFDVKFGKTKYTGDGEIDFKFSLIEKGASAEIADRDNRIGMQKNGVHPMAIGESFENKGKVYTIESVQARKQKYSVVTKSTTGERVRFPAEYINRMVAKSTGQTLRRYSGNTAILDPVKGN